MIETIRTEVAALRAQYSRPDDDGVAIVGSFARGDAGPCSDLDLTWFRAAPQEDKHKFFSLGDRLVSLLFTTVAEATAQLAKPEEAVWAARGLAGMKIITDRTGALASLRARAAALDWRELQEAADAHASKELAGFAEEAAKLVNALLKSDEYSATNAVTWLWIGLAKAMAVHLGVQMTSENSWLAAVADAVGRGTTWACWLRASCGIDPVPAGNAPALWRAEAGIRLYLETALILDATLLADDRRTVSTACRYIEGWLIDGLARQ